MEAGDLWLMNKDAWQLWAILYDRDDVEIARYKVLGSATIGNLLITYALNHHDIEYIKIVTA